MASMTQDPNEVTTNTKYSTNLVVVVGPNHMLDCAVALVLLVKALVRTHRKYPVHRM